MSKKNSSSQRKRYNDYLVREEQRQAEKRELIKKRREDRLRMSAQDQEIAKKRAEASKKPKVAPVVAKQAKLLKKALKSMTITTASKKIDMNDSSSSDSSG